MISFFKKFFRPKENLNNAGNQMLPGGQRISHAQKPLESDIMESIANVTALEVRLGTYYQAHLTPDNTVLLEIADNLGANNAALLYLLGLGRSEFGEIQVNTLLKKLEGTGKVKGLEESLVSELKRLLPGIKQLAVSAQEQLRQQYISKCTALLNMYFDAGRKLLLMREMKDKGFSDALVERALAADSPHVFR